jgi:NAD+ diphosphatase
MIGCHAFADDPTVTVDQTELEDARWFTRAEVEDAMRAIMRGEGGTAFRAPPGTAVAHHLLRWWVNNG